jgi:hypothetical protein
MSSWGNYDNAANAPYWAVNSTLTTVDAQPVGTRPTAANVALLYGNTTPNVYTTGETIGLFAVDAAEEQVAENAGVKPAHSGWVLRTVGIGGRAGRVTEEVLVALSQVVTDNASDNTQFPNATITISQPVALQNVTANASGSNTVTLSVSGTTVVPAGAVLTYQWQVNNNTGGTWVNIDNGVNVSTGQPGNMIKSNANTAILTLAPTTNSSNNSVYRAVITATNPGITNSTVTAYSANGQVRIY